MINQLDRFATRQDSAAKLLLLLARPRLTPGQQELTRFYAARISDWDDFAQLATKKFVVTFARRHLQSCAADIVPAEPMARMLKFAKSATLATLRVAAAQITFHKACIDKTGAEYAYLKGLALASQYSGNIGERFCRDVDVLVPQHCFDGVLKAAIESEYQVFIDDMPGKPINDAQDLRFLSRYVDVISLVGKDAIPIEVHKRLDKRHLNFDWRLALSTSEPVTVSGVLLQTLSKPLHFNYLCCHHARHFWSHLHWVADLNAFAQAPTFDQEHSIRLADRIGIRPTIEAALEFSELTAHPERWQEAISKGSGGGQFLQACLVNLNGGMELEESLRSSRPFGDVMSAWQISPHRHRGVSIRSWLRRLHPNATQYFRTRYPPVFHWVYSLRNAASLVFRGVAAAIGIDRRGSKSHAQKPARAVNGVNP